MFWWQGHVFRLFQCVHVRGCRSVRLWLEPPLGCRYTPITHVAVPCGGGDAQLWHWGGIMRIAACLSERTESARARPTSEIWDRVCGTVSVTRLSRLQVEGLCMFLSCFDLSKPSTFNGIIPICALSTFKITFGPPTSASPIRYSCIRVQAHSAMCSVYRTMLTAPASTQLCRLCFCPAL